MTIAINNLFKSVAYNDFGNEIVWLYKVINAPENPQAGDIITVQRIKGKRRHDLEGFEIGVRVAEVLADKHSDVEPFQLPLVNHSVYGLTFVPPETDYIAELITKTDKDGKPIVIYEFYE